MATIYLLARDPAGNSRHDINPLLGQLAAAGHQLRRLSAGTEAFHLLEQGEGDLVLVEPRAFLEAVGEARQAGGGPVAELSEDLTEKRQLCQVTAAVQLLSFSQAPIGLCVLDETGRFVTMNGRLRKKLGCLGEELPSSDLFDLLHPDERLPNRRLFQRLVSGEKDAVQCDARLLQRDGSTVWIHLRMALVLGAESTWVVASVQDVTEHKKLEEQLCQAQKMEAIGLLAGGVAHDFNNIVALVNGYATLAKDALAKGDEAGCFLEQVLHACDRATALTQSLLAFSKKQSVQLATIDVNQVISQFESWVTRLVRAGIRLRTACSMEPAAILADRGQIEQVLMNLVANALEAMPQGGEVIIETALDVIGPDFIKRNGYGRVGEYVRVSVSDTGTGMSRDTLSHIFEPFFTTKEGKGTGLGLSSVYGIVKQHEGYIEAHSEPGLGSTFHLYLPRCGGAAGVAAPADSILICDGDDASRRLLNNDLRRAGYRVIEAIDGKDAVVKFKQFRNSIKLVVLDGLMPGKNGRQVCDEIHALSPGMKTIFVSGYCRSEIKLTSQQEVCFMQKPVSNSDLCAKVRLMLEK